MIATVTTTSKSHEISLKSLQTLLFTNLILSLFLILFALVSLSFWFWNRIQNVRRELKGQNNNLIFPISDKPNYPVTPEINSTAIPSVAPKSISPSSPSSLLTKSLTSADFAAKSLLDKKVFAASGNVQKSSSAGLKDLI